MSGAAADVEHKACNRCSELKPITEFYAKGDGFRQPMCRDCDNARPRSRNLSKIVRVRARHRATAELIKRHDAEFRDLLEYFTETATEEAEQLAGQLTAAARPDHDHDSDEPVVPRLRPGVRRKGQKAANRIDVGRCPHCAKSHDRGHVCPKCGAVPNHALHRSADGVIDEIAIERRIKGEPVQLSTPELAEAVRLLAARGDNATRIGRCLRMSGARVEQILASHEHHAGRTA